MIGKPKDRVAAAIAEASRRHRIPLTPAQVWILAGIAADVLAVPVRNPEPSQPEALLNEAHTRLLVMVANGASDDDCARRLRIEPVTVRSAMKSIRHRLGANDRAHAVAVAMARKLITGSQIWIPPARPRQKFGPKPKEAA